MSTQDAFTAAKTVSAMYAGFSKDAAEAMGVDKALDLHRRQGHAMGVMMVEAMRQALGGTPFDTATMESVMVSADAMLGITPAIETTPVSMKQTVHGCPFYEGFKAAGLDHATIEKVCAAFSAGEAEAIAAAYPFLEHRLEFRATPDGACTEEFRIVKRP